MRDAICTGIALIAMAALLAHLVSVVGRGMGFCLPVLE